MNRDYAHVIEMQLKTLAFAKSVAKSKGPHEKYLGVIQSEALASAEPFFWSETPARAVLEAARSIPADTCLTHWNLPIESAWWWFDVPVFDTTTLEGTSHTHVMVRAMTLVWIGTNFVITPWSDSERTPGHLFPCAMLKWPEGQSLQNMAHAKHYDIRENIIGTGHGTLVDVATPSFIIAALAWLEQRILVKTDAHVHRARRREFQRVTGQRDIDVQIVNLRRSIYEEHEKTDDDAHDKTKFSCQWVVGGHWRHQPCGHARADRRLTWIHPYLKGPDGMPLRESKPKLNVVTR